MRLRRTTSAGRQAASWPVLWKQHKKYTSLTSRLLTSDDGVVAAPVKEYAGRIAGTVVHLVSLGVGTIQTN